MLVRDDIDAMTPTWRTHEGDFLLRAVAPDDAGAELRVVQHVLSLGDVEDLALLAGGLADGATRATDAGGYAVEGDEVVLWDADDNEARTAVSHLAALLARMVDVALTHRDDPAADARPDTWAALERLAETLRD